jgi:hypothetical protein
LEKPEAAKQILNYFTAAALFYKFRSTSNVLKKKK